MMMMKRASRKRAADKAIPELLEGQKDRVEAFEELQREGLTLEQIGERFNISRQRVHQILKKGKRKSQIVAGDRPMTQRNKMRQLFQLYGEDGMEEIVRQYVKAEVSGEVRRKKKGILTTEEYTVLLYKDGIKKGWIREDGGVKC